MVEAVLALWEDADVVALGERHGSQLDSDFRIALVKHPSFGATVDVIVVEFANAHRQEVLDRYITGEPVSRADLVRIWRDTGYETWDSPIYEAFLTAVREANAALPAEQKIRVIAGDSEGAKGPAGVRQPARPARGRRFVRHIARSAVPRSCARPDRIAAAGGVDQPASVHTEPRPGSEPRALGRHGARELELLPDHRIHRRTLGTDSG
jgi:hypothetical protein